MFCLPKTAWPPTYGIEVARRLREEQVDVRILVLSAYDDHEYIRALLDIGVSGYLVKGEASGKIVEAVRGVARGQKGWVSPQVRKKLEKMQDSVYKQTTLSFRDLELLRLLAAGKSEEEIAAQWKMDIHGIRSIMESLSQKMGEENKDRMVEIAIREGWIGRP